MQKETKQNNCNTIIKRIKNTTYEVNIYFSKTSRETLNDKISRLIRNEVA